MLNGRLSFFLPGTAHLAPLSRALVSRSPPSSARCAGNRLI